MHICMYIFGSFKLKLAHIYLYTRTLPGSFWCHSNILLISKPDFVIQNESKGFKYIWNTWPIFSINLHKSHNLVPTIDFVMYITYYFLTIYNKNDRII